MHASKNEIIARRDDGFTLSLAQPEDYPKLIDLANNLSDQSKQHFHTWTFRKNPSLKVKIAQTLVRLSLNPHVKKLIKAFFPFAHVVIIKVQSPENKIVGMYGFFRFKRLSDGKFSARSGVFLIEEFQSKGLLSFIHKPAFEMAKKENIRIIYSLIRTDNVRSKKVYTRTGWKYIETIKNAGEYKGKSYDSEVWIYEILILPKK